ncbi:hypothetical protein [Kibdelosporangium aridum]|uniref:Uncharacterized protein n=1 Tax=Kibdelosporangium aridum TaxID=2030 RepID=A0A1W2CQ04_KIBAR|nr:hypothetical protein [Kibdelosporangium aridum]SMC86708.1 hypothetical protein SAMN05661093_02387 [Kibdelosporangium aridum]
MANRVLWVGLSGIAVFAVTMTVIEIDAQRPKPEPTVELAEAEALFNRAVHLVENKRFDDFCREIADWPQSCERDVDWNASIGWRPGPKPPRVVGVKHGGQGFPPVMLNLVGERDDGTTYTASFGVRKTYDGRVVSSYPVYWSGVDYIGAPEACTEQPCPPIPVPPPTG